MFSEIIKREITKLMLAIFVYTNLSPAFCMQGMSEYVVNVKRREIQNDITKEIVKGFAIQVLQRQLLQEALQQTTFIPQEPTEKILFENDFVSPFMALAAYTASQMTALASLTEILRQETLTIEDKENQGQKKDIETTVSDGFCLKIDGIGDLLISHDGDIVLDSQNFDKSLSISSPSKVFLNNSTSKNLEIKAGAAFLFGDKKVKMESLKFIADKDSEESQNGLFISAKAELEIDQLEMENALLANAGKLTIRQVMNLNGGDFLNNGTILTTADPSKLMNISYFQNTETGKIEASGKLILEANSLVNSGEIKAKEADIISSGILNNSGKLITSQKLQLKSFTAIQNEGEIVSSQNADISAPQLLNLKTIKGQNVSIKTDKLTENRGDITSNQAISINSLQLLNGANSSISGKDLKISVTESIQNDGSLNSDNSTEIKSQNFLNTGTTKSARNSQINTSNLLENRGTIEAKTNSVSTPNLMNKEGRLVGSTSLNLNSDNFFNEGEIDGKSGTTTISGKAFGHKKGIFKGARVNLNSANSSIESNFEGQELFVNGTTVNRSITKFGRFVLNGTFENVNEGSKFTEIELTGKESKFLNKGKLEVERIISNSDKGIFAGGEITATSITSNKSLYLDSIKAGNLQIARTAKGGNLSIVSSAQTPNLTTIENAGTTYIDTNISSISSIRNETGSDLTLKSTANLYSLKNLDSLRGTVLIKANMYGLENLNVANGTKLHFLEGSNLPNLKTITNNGEFVSRTAVNNLVNVTNNYGGNLHFYAGAKISQTVINAGNLVLAGTTENPEIVIGSSDSDTKYKNFFMGRYVGKSGSILQIEKTNLGLKGIYNDGTIQFNESATIKQLDGKIRVTKEFILQEKKNKLDQLGWPRTTRFASSIDCLTQLAEERFKDRNENSDNYAKSVRSMGLSEANKNYVNIRIALNEMLKNPQLSVTDAANLAAQICAKNSITLDKSTISDTVIYLNSIDIQNYIEAVKDEIPQSSKLGKITVTKQSILQEKKNKLDQLGWPRTKQFASSIDCLTQLVEERFKDRNESSDNYVKSVGSMNLSEANKNYVNIRVALNEMLKNPKLTVNDAANLAAQICAKNSITLGKSTISDTVIYLNSIDIQNYIESFTGIKTDSKISSQILKAIIETNINETKIGKTEVKGNLKYELAGEGSVELTDLKLIPALENMENTFKVVASKNINVNSPVSFPYYFDLETPNFYVNNQLNVQNFKIKTGNFKVGSAGNIQSQKELYVDGVNFSNTSGKIQALSDITFNLTGDFTNTGGEVTGSQGVSYTYYTTKNVPVPDGLDSALWKDDSLIVIGHYSIPGKNAHGDFADVDYVSHTGYTDITTHNLDYKKAGQIGSGGKFSISAKSVDNSFGCLGSNKDFTIISKGQIYNKVGVIYSKGETTLNGTNFENGWFESNYVQKGIDPNRPIKETMQKKKAVKSISNQVYKKIRNGGATFILYKEEVRFVPFGTMPVITGYQSNTIPLKASKSPGYIFSTGNVNLNVNFDASLGTIVSEDSIYVNGISQSKRGNLIAKGNVKLQMESVELEQMYVQAKNIAINLIEPITLQKYIEAIKVNEKSEITKINIAGLLQELSTIMGQKVNLPLTDGKNSMGMIFPYSNPTMIGQNLSIPIRNASEKLAFVGEKPVDDFASSVHPVIMQEFIKMWLTPIYGRDILVNIEIVSQFEQNGANAQNSKFFLRLPGGNPMIVFEKVKDKFLELEDEFGNKKQFPVYNPYLIYDTLCRLLRGFYAEKSIALRTEDKLKILPGGNNIIHAPEQIYSGKFIELISEVVYQNKINPVAIKASSLVKFHADDTILSQAVDISSRKIDMSAGNKIVDEPIVTSEFHSDQNGAYIETTSHQSTIKGTENVNFFAPETNHTGTNIYGGTVEIGGEKYTNTEARNTVQGFSTSQSGRQNTRIDYRISKALQSKIEADKLIINSKDAKIRITDIVSPIIVDNSDNFTILAPRDYSEIHSISEKKKRSFFGLLSGKSTIETWEKHETVHPTQIRTQSFESNGHGKLTIEAANINAVQMHITKHLEEIAAYEKHSTKIVTTSKGFFAPKFNGDQLVKAFEKLPENANTFGDIAPKTLNMVSQVTQAATQSMVIANLRNSSNPWATVAQIGASRYLSGIGYSNSKSTTTHFESRPIQSNIEVGALWIDNDITSLQGIWNIGHASINSEKLIVDAPKYESHTKTERSGWSISISPASIIGTSILGATPASLIPSTSIHDSDGSQDITQFRPAVIGADKLLIRINDGIFSGSTIRSKLFDMVATGDVTVQSLTNTFKSESNSTEIAASIGTLFGHVKEKRLPFASTDPKLDSIPVQRSVEECIWQRKVDDVAKLAGYENFYLKVGKALHDMGAEIGLVPDGKIVTSQNQHIEAQKIIKQQIETEEKSERHVFTPMFGEAAACVAQINEFNQVRAQFMAQRVCDGADFKTAEKEAEAMGELLETKEVKESYKNLKENNEKLAAAAEKIDQIDRKNEEAASKLGSDQHMGEFLNCAFKSVERENAVKEYNSIARGCLLGLTKMREGIQTWAQHHPQYAKVAEYTMDAVGYGVMVASTVALASSFAATASVSIPLAVTGLGVTLAKDRLIKFSKEEIIDYAGKQGSNNLESEKFTDTARWIFTKVENLIDTFKFSKIVKNPVDSIKNSIQNPKLLKTYTKFDKYGEIALAINQSANAYSKSQKANLLSDVLSKLGE